MIGLKEKILDRFMKTDVGQQILHDEQQELHGQRVHAAEVIAMLEKERAETLPKLDSAVQVKKAELVELQQRTTAVKREFVQAEIESISAHNRYQSELGAQRSLLHDTAPAVLQEYLAALLKFYSDSRRGAPEQVDVFPNTSGHDIGLIERQREKLNARWKHSLGVKEFHQVVRDTIEDVKALFVQPITDAEAERKIELFRKRIAKAQKAAGVILN
jgi:hypothetical protein